MGGRGVRAGVSGAADKLVVRRPRGRRRVRESEGWWAAEALTGMVDSCRLPPSPFKFPLLSAARNHVWRPPVRPFFPRRPRARRYGRTRPIPGQRRVAGRALGGGGHIESCVRLATAADDQKTRRAPATRRGRSGASWSPRPHNPLGFPVRPTRAPLAARRATAFQIQATSARGRAPGTRKRAGGGESWVLFLCVATAATATTDNDGASRASLWRDKSGRRERTHARRPRGSAPRASQRSERALDTATTSASSPLSSKGVRPRSLRADLPPAAPRRAAAARRRRRRQSSGHHLDLALLQVRLELERLRPRVRGRQLERHAVREVDAQDAAVLVHRRVLCHLSLEPL